jgi:peptidoglycan hydrolase-like protein with peptidoglycan-binding domain
MELAAYIYDAWAYEQAHQDASDLHLIGFDEFYSGKSQQNHLVWHINAIKWRSYLLSAIAATGFSGLGFQPPVEAHYLLEPSVNVAPWCENVYLCNTNYVVEVQTLLSRRGYVVGEIDGVYGRHTKKAVMEFQRSQANLLVDGIPGEKTLALLRNSLTDTSVSRSVLPPASSDNSNKPNSYLREQSKNQVNGSDRLGQPVIVRTINAQSNAQSSEGEEMGNLQILLKQRGFYQGEIDGRQGQSTTDAVMKAQQAYGLSPDGFVGPLTIRALLAGGNNIALSEPAVTRSPATEDVLQAQLLLKERGFYAEELNGAYNIRTRASISNAQAAYGQKVTGELSSDLIAALKGQNISQSTGQSDIPSNGQNSSQSNQSNQDIRPSPSKPSNQSPNNNNSQAPPTSGQNALPPSAQKPNA